MTKDELESVREKVYGAWVETNTDTFDLHCQELRNVMNALNSIITQSCLLTKKGECAEDQFETLEISSFIVSLIFDALLDLLQRLPNYDDQHELIRLRGVAFESVYERYLEACDDD
jgi:hypothetical protein